MPPRRLTPGEARQYLNRVADATLGRHQGPTLWWNGTTTLGGLTGGSTRTQIPRPLSLARPLESLMIVLRFRLVIGAAAYTTGVPEAPQTLLERVIITGTHKRLGQVTLVDMSGATLFALPRVFQGFGNDLIIDTAVAGAPVRSADPGVPFVQTATGYTTPAATTLDTQIFYEIPFGPMLGRSPSAKRAMMPYLLRPEDWGDTLQVELVFGDRTSLGTPNAATTTTFTAYGSAAGLPTVEVFANYSLMGQFANAGQNGLLVRNEQLVSTALVAVATDQQLGSDLRKQITSNLVIKTGTTQAGTSAGVNVFATLSDLQLDRTRIIADDKAIRDTGRNYATKNYLGRSLDTVIPEGYFLHSFVESGQPATSLRADRIAAGASFRLVTDVLAAAAANRQHILQEIIYGGPFLR